MRERLFLVIDKTKYIIEFIISTVLLINIQLILISAIKEENISRKCIAMVIFFSIVLLIFLIIFLKKNVKYLERVFLAFMIPIGMFYIIFVTPNRAYDEVEHVYRAYNVSKGKIIAERDDKKQAETWIPEDVINILKLCGGSSYTKTFDIMKENTNYGNEVKVFNSAQGYSPTLYVFPALVFKIGRHFNINFLILEYIARTCNFIFFLILGYYSIKMMPFGKLLMYVYLFNPMIVNQAVSLSADSMIDSITLFYIAYILYLLKTKESIKVIDKVILSIFTVLIALAKYVYFPILFMSCLILIKNKKDKKENKIFIIVLLIVGILLAGSWFLVSSRYVDTRPYIQENNVDSMGQIKFIAKHPIFMASVIGKTTYELGEKVFTEFLGYRISPYEVFTSIPCIFFYALMLISSIFADDHKKQLCIKEKIIMTTIGLLLYILVLVGMYIIWTEVGKDVVSDLQGRYFIPVFIIPLICAINKKNTLKYNINKTYIFYSIAMLLINIQTVVPTIESVLHY